MAFDSTIQKVKCPFCDTEFEMDTLAAYDERPVSYTHLTLPTILLV